ncbi:hypothetical protein [Actinomycetospora cinnamomea]|uniref:mRNA-degrading endonuclease RelE of RelBE toxin-antitoxin system n=1 Tax=Actinomycetospora cinnamomea TaxID=663609 RepID=A0A2U1FFU2_9PSEU|nr:hypothetical protein [Actinomycetospora cinnamomea]PVZ11028.1 hypothetical protein C8D89_104242 [Actinomycetospora cinnamomea]
MYRVETVGEDIDAAIDALPRDFVPAFDDLRSSLQEAPWDIGRPYVASNPRGSRTATFGPEGRGLVLYVVQERERVVALWQVTVAPI